MGHLIDLEHIARYINSNDRKEIVLDILYEHSCELKLECLVEAIELYWQSKEDQLTDEEYKGAQEQSTREQGILSSKENIRLMRGHEDDEGID